MAFSTLISPENLAAYLDDSNWVVLDCRFALNDTERGRQAYQESHISGACYAHLDKDLSGPIIPGKTGRHPLPDVDAFAQKLSAWGIDESVQVVAYDDMGGPFAARLWWMLHWLGHKAVAVLDGGWPAWVEAGYPVDRIACTPAPRVFAPRPQDQLLASAEDVNRVIHKGGACLVDARAEERYAGRHEPIDPVAGHIPSAVCYPWTENLDENKRFLSSETLHTRYTGLPDNTELICYCGSGVTGAHDVLALVHAGFPMPRLYAGSWSEWITDPSRPIARLQ